MRTAFFFCILILMGQSAFAEPPSFDLWKAELRRDAALRGVPETLFDTAMGNMQPLPDVLELDRKQPESTRTFTQYLGNTVNANRIARAQGYYAQYRDLLERVAKQYGVPAQYIVALWGMETDFGDNTGGFSIVEALATLAYDGRRAAFFREELIQALLILKDGPVPLSEFQGSWAGAMGQCQFMPSSYRKFAVDGDGDGHKDIWYSQADVFASIANYLAGSGWNAKESWGHEVRLAIGFDPALADGKTKRTLGEWQKLGVLTMAGTPVPAGDAQRILLYPDTTRSNAYLVTSNYEVILKWNRSRYFATAVGTLADAIIR